MDDKKMVHLFDGVDDDLVRQANEDMNLWMESREGMRIEPAPRKPRWRMVAASAAGVAAAAVGTVVLMSNIGNIRLSENSGQYGPGAAREEIAELPEESAVTSAPEENAVTDNAAPIAQLPKITAAIMSWDNDLVYGVLGDNYTFNVEERPDDYYPGHTKTLWCDTDENGVERLYLANSPTDIYYHSPKNGLDYISYFSHHEVCYNDPDIKFSDELDGFTKEDAIRRAKGTAEKLGITNLGEPTVFALTAEESNAYTEREIEKFGRDELKEGPYIPWTKDDEAYFITFPLMYGETPAVPDQIAMKKSTGEGIKGSFHGAYVKVAVTKDKIVAFDAKGITKPEYTVGEPVNINFTKDDILKKVTADNPYRDPSGPETFYGCELVYVPVEITDTGYVYAPAWKVDYGCNWTYNDPETGESVYLGEAHRTAIYSAETGERVNTYPMYIEKAETGELTDTLPDYIDEAETDEFTDLSPEYIENAEEQG